MWFIALLSAGLWAQSSPVLNMTHDLVAKGVFGTNLAPDTPALDARPIFEAAVAYAQKNGIATVTADPGSYYFLSLHNANTHVLLGTLSKITIDLANSDLYFQKSNVSAFQCNACTAFTMQNFTVDYLTLPYTQFTVTAVDAAKRNLMFATIPGYQSPADFNTNRSPTTADAIYMFVFRNGTPIRETGRLQADRPVQGTTIHVTADNNPWSANLAAIQKGDTVVFSDRSGPPAMNFNGGDNITVHNVSIYAAGAIALYFGRVSNSVADQVQVIPRPGTSRLISSNADGIHHSFGLANNLYSNNIVRRTCDDALAMASEWVGSVNSQSNGTNVVVSRAFNSPLPVGGSVAFIDNLTAAVAGTAKVTAENPPPSQQTNADGELLTLTLDQPINGLAKGFGVTNPDPAARSGGSMIRNNLVQEGVFSRGIWLSGVENVTVQDNLVQRTSNDGIYIQQLNGGNSVTGPSSGIAIQNNIVDGAITYGAVSAPPTVSGAAINIDSLLQSDAPTNTTPNANVTFSGNRVTNSPRSALRIENVSGGAIANNTIQGFGLDPATNLWDVATCAKCETMAQWIADFKVAVVIPTGSNTNVTSSGNTTTEAALGIGSNASGSPRIAPDSIASAYGVNLAAAALSNTAPVLPTALGGVSVKVKDSAGVERQAAIFFVSPAQVNFLVPTGTAPGNATITIGAATGGAQIAGLAPGILAIGSGVALAAAALYSADGTITPETLFQCAASGCTSTPISLGGASDQLVVTLYGTGLRGLSSLGNAVARIGGAAARLLYVGPQGQFSGLDQVNVVVPRSLAGAGEVPIVLTLDGQTANVVTINLK